MALELFSKFGQARIAKMTGDFCTVEVYEDYISATELQALLDEDWVQQGEGIRLKHGSEEMVYNFRKIQRS